ncbi:hypothetical protein [Cylindrospermopsis raciborskii]|nr:hypothetical protein [Cylindrospermopsis raciborskii]
MKLGIKLVKKYCGSYLCKQAIAFNLPLRKTIKHNLNPSPSAIARH